MNKILRCECGKLYIQESDELKCKRCLAKQEVNDDPFDVTSKNILRLIQSYSEESKTVKNKRYIKNSLLEIDFILNNAYVRGYISESFYNACCVSLGLEPEYNDVKSLSQNDYYDYSANARLGFYQDLLENVAE